MPKKFFVEKDDKKQIGTGLAAHCNFILKRVYNNKNFLGVITGPTGSGKSYAMLRLMEILNPDKTPEEIIKNVAFDAQEYMARINSGELKAGDVLSWDESGVSLSSRNWQSLANKSINYLLQTYRNMNLIGMFNLPYFSFLDSQSRKLMHSLCNTVAIDRNTNRVMMKPFVLQVSQHSGKIYNPFLKIKTKNGYLKVKEIGVGLPSPELIKLYEAKKKKFTIKLNQSIDKMLDTTRKKEEKLINNLTNVERDCIEDIEQGLSAEESGKKRGRDANNVRAAIRRAKFKGYIVKKPEKRKENVGFSAETRPNANP